MIGAELLKQAGFVSIPNGMEFYYTRGEEIERRSAFQFPTGWNYTEASDD